ncbi:MAG: CHAD domain-containing protein [Bacteroidetes bacterium]|nr:CHAD domain-containing protein [Bacteroidota bacterium]MBU1718619.1 CHAD domain-containing protein [Bacteroidota bacterium]
MSQEFTTNEITDLPVAEVIANDLIWKFRDHVLKMPGNPEFHIHEARKSIKMLQAVLRTRSEFDASKKIRKIDDRLRNVARILAPSRESFVFLETFHYLSNFRFVKLTAEENLGVVDVLLRFREKKTNKLLKLLHGGDFRQFITGGLETAIRKTMRNVDYKDQAKAFRQTYKRGKKLANNALAEPSDNNLRDLRLEVTFLQYQVKFFGDLMSPEMRHLFRKIESLSEGLGHIHDLDVFLPLIKAGFFNHISERKQEQLTESIAEVRSMLLSEAQIICSEVYNRKAKEVVG